MATSPISLQQPSAAGGASPQGGAPGAGGSPSPGAGGSASTLLSQFQALPSTQKAVFLNMAADKFSGENPEVAPMMREIQNQVRMATMKMIQQRAATQQATPQI